MGSQNIGYDLNGNLTSDGAFAFAYDPENRLMAATKTGTSVAYAYDPLGRRTTKTVNRTIRPPPRCRKTRLLQAAFARLRMRL